MWFFWKFIQSPQDTPKGRLMPKYTSHWVWARGSRDGGTNGAVGMVTDCRPGLACTAAASVPRIRASWWLTAVVSGSWLHPKTSPSSLALTWLWLCSVSKLRFCPLSQKVKAGLCTLNCALLPAWHIACSGRAYGPEARPLRLNSVSLRTFI